MDFAVESLCVLVLDREMYLIGLEPDLVVQFTLSKFVYDRLGIGSNEHTIDHLHRGIGVKGYFGLGCHNIQLMILNI